MLALQMGRLALAGLVALTITITLSADGALRETRPDAPAITTRAVYHSPASAVPPSEHQPVPRGDYMPLHAGRSLTYRTVDGARFTLTFGAPRTVRWFDGTAKQVVPVHDTRCRCQILLTQSEGQVRAIGSVEGDEISRWGEYIIVFPGKEAATQEPVTTPAGRFAHAVRVETAEGTTWFAPGIGIVQTDHYVLVSAENFY